MVRFLALLSLLIDAPVAAAPIPDDAKDAIKAEISDRLFDGESARWRWNEPIDGQSMYCGWVNGKNRFGAYVGFKPYMVMLMQGTKGHVTALIDIGQTDTSETVILEMCREEGFPMTDIPSE